MKSQLNRMLIVATVALLGVAASALPAAAQGVAGHFTLPHAVRWQNADLAAGEYTFSLPSLTTMSAMTVKGPKGAIFILTRGVSNPRAEGQGVLVLEERAGTYYVREMDLPGIVQLNYNVPKRSHDDEPLAMAKPGTAATEQVMIAMVRK